ncbi:VacJ family lipoprotein [Ruegeria sp. 2205SS24-7]|uniref:MlaA family lipoprotein n=1 Tax=Ruegeria discodermiae TaxID=3064389 RepID=UPI002742634E|nr:VacJ family lipoprotein [Ruegeria sp. 2205SS24-7]MDP5218325.1 VacJ family lipoprotein [Ruegeria sp. 2205SS24-7]
MRYLTSSWRLLCALTLAALVAGCATKTPEQRARGEIFDPYENTNRSIHAFNRGVDKAIFRPASKGYVTVVPAPVVTGFSNFAENLSYPGQALDFLLQGNPREACIAVGRFLLNTTYGLAGFFDPASEMNIPRVDTNFGETLHVWGFGEGAYVELPLYGPSTTRDAVGVVTNAITNPLGFGIVRPVENIGVYAEVLRRMGDRGNFSDTVDSILYGSADSYAQARLIYLQNRRFELANSGSGSTLDLYADPYAEFDTGTDVYDDPYEDPYAQ